MRKLRLILGLATVSCGLSITQALAQAPTPSSFNAADALTLSAFLKQGYEIRSVVSGLNIFKDGKVTKTRFVLSKGVEIVLCDTPYDVTQLAQPTAGTYRDAPGGQTTCQVAKFD